MLPGPFHTICLLPGVRKQYLTCSQVPGFVVAFAKGKDYMVGQMGGFTEGKKF